MKHTITIQKTENSRVKDVDFDNLPFGKVFTDHMFVADYINGEWTNCEIKPLSSFEIHPGNMAWHYGQSIFEGMKATRDNEGTPLLFRPELHAQRLNASAERMCMPELPEQLFLDAVNSLVAIEKAWIPPNEGSALYIRPFMFATDEFIGVRPSETYKMVILTMPVGPYYGKPVHLKAETNFVRAAIGGVGEAKTAGNYAAALYPAKLAKEEGIDQIMWLDAKEFKYIQEVGTMNIFFVIDNEIITPSCDGAILKGITRNSIIVLLRDMGYRVTERPIEINEIVQASYNGSLQEAFGSGTAAVIAPVASITYKGKRIELIPDDFKVAPQIKDKINGIRTRKYPDNQGWLVPAELAMELA